MTRLLPFEVGNQYTLKKAGIVPGDRTTNAGKLLIKQLNKLTYEGIGVLSDSGKNVRFRMIKSWIYHIVNLLDGERTVVSYFIVPYADAMFVRSGERVLVNGSPDPVPLYRNKADRYIKFGGHYVDIKKNFTQI